MEFGQTPKQLFTKPHPCKLSLVDLARNEVRQLPIDQSTSNTQPNTCQKDEFDSAKDLETPLEAEAKDNVWGGIEKTLETGAIVCDHTLHKGSVSCVQWDEKGETVYSVDSGM